MPNIAELSNETRLFFAELNEKQRRHGAALLFRLLGYGSQEKVAEATGVSARTIRRGCEEFENGLADCPEERIRKPGAGRPPSKKRPDIESEIAVIAIDNVLIDHYGKTIEDVGYFWDHAEQRSKIAHDYLFANYVCTSGKHYPLYFRRFRKQSQCEADGQEFTNHTKLCIELIDQVCDRKTPGVFTWDSYFTNAQIMNHVHKQEDDRGNSRGYVGDLKMNRKVVWKGTEQKISELAESIASSDKKELRRGDNRQWHFTVTLKIPGVNHKVRVLIIWDKRRDAKPKKVLVTNRTNWEAKRIVMVYRNRWTGTECFHRDGKQELGMGKCQLRDGHGQTRHMVLVMMAYSLLVGQLHHARPRDWALVKLTTIGEACRAILRETMRDTLAWAIDQVVNKSRNHKQITAQLVLGFV